jgi:hypothetical protein
MGLGQSQQASLGGQDLPEPVAERHTQITGLAGLLGDDQIGMGDNLTSIPSRTNRGIENIWDRIG